MPDYSGFVYEWTNLVNGKKYIGSHIGTIDDGYTGSGAIFLKAVRKYGIESFERTILEIVQDRDQVRVREQHYLDERKVASDPNYYNVRAKVDGGFEHINTNPVFIEAARERCKWIGKASSRFKGKGHTEETKQKQREASIRWSLENKAVEVHQFDLTGVLIASFPSFQEAARSVGGSPSNIKYTCEGRFRHAYGYQWSYKTTMTALDRPDRVMGKKQVHTPDGVFDTVTATMKHYGLKSTTEIRRRCLSTDPKWSDWYYIL